MAVSESNQRRSLENRITELAEQVAASMGMEVVLIEIKGDENRSVVRAYIDHSGQAVFRYNVTGESRP